MGSRELEAENKKPLCFGYVIPSATCGEDERLLQPRQLTDLTRMCLPFEESGSAMVTEDEIVKKRHAEQENGWLLDFAPSSWKHLPDGVFCGNQG